MSIDRFNAHQHDNNDIPPHYDFLFELILPDKSRCTISLNQLQSDYPTAEIPAYSYTTDHGRHGPHRLLGVALIDLLTAELAPEMKWKQVEVVSADGYGNRVWAHELISQTDEPIMLCWQSNGRDLTIEQGCIRLVVPSETDNALRQIKWVATIRVLP